METREGTVDARRNSGSFRFPDGSSIVRPVEMDWTPWALSGTRFKLLSFNRRAGVWSCIVKFDAGTRIPPLRQFGDAFVYVMDGGCATDGHAVAAGHFSVEAGGTTNDRVAGPDGMTAYMMFMGGFTATDANGHPTGTFVDGEWAYDAANGRGFADHIPAPVQRARETISA